MSRHTLAAVAVASMLAAGAASAQTAEDAFGIWRHPENGSHVEIYKCGSDLCARIAKVTDGQKSDDKNPDAAKKARPIVGLVIMQSAKKAGATSWQGQLYNRADGGNYAGTITVKSKDQIDLSGCTAVVICKTVSWSRVK